MKRVYYTNIVALLSLFALSGCAGGGDATPQAGALTVPTGLAATAVSSSSIALSWDAYTDPEAISGYRVSRAGTEVGTSAANAWTDTGLASGTTYTYTVVCYDAAGNVSAHSDPASATTFAAGADAAPPSAPSGLTAVTAGSDRINLAWSASTDDIGVAGYELWRDNALVTTVTTTSYADTGLAPSTSYTYAVKAFDLAGNVSPASDPATAATAAASAAVRLPQTGQTACYSGTGAVIDCVNTGQNGELQKGAAWPSPRFTANADTTITDNLTGLAWAPNGDLMPSRDPGWDADKTPDDGMVTWQHALEYVAKLNTENYLGHNDWRLPNRRELRSLVNYGVIDTVAWLNSQGFTGAQSVEYWSSTSWAVNARYAWYVYLLSGYVIDDSNKDDAFSLWPVRAGDGEYAATAPLPATGQTNCSDANGAPVSCAGTGQDGELRKGIAWPDPRFIDNGDGTQTDNLTGLVWSKDGNAPGPAACAPGAAKTWQAALAYAACLNANGYLGHSDWRLPDLNELGSLLHADQLDTSAWLNTMGFYSVQSGLYWSSTTYVVDAADACLIHMNQGDIWYVVKSDSYFVWPVRGGE
jgi:chitodextrinase